MLVLPVPIPSTSQTLVDNLVENWLVRMACRTTLHNKAYIKHPDIQLNIKSSNIFGTTEICSRHG